MGKSVCSGVYWCNRDAERDLIELVEKDCVLASSSRQINVVVTQVVVILLRNEEEREIDDEGGAPYTSAAGFCCLLLLRVRRWVCESVSWGE